MMKKYALLIIFSLTLLSSCGAENKINQSTHAIQRNTAAIEQSTIAIERNLVELKNIQENQ